MFNDVIALRCHSATQALRTERGATLSAPRAELGAGRRAGQGEAGGMREKAPQLPDFAMIRDVCYLNTLGNMSATAMSSCHDMA